MLASQFIVLKSATRTTNKIIFLNLKTKAVKPEKIENDKIWTVRLKLMIRIEQKYSLNAEKL